MGLLKGIIGNVIENGIGNGISKAVSGAVESAVEKVVKPAAENFANVAAKNINDSAAALNEANWSAKEAEILVGSVLGNFPKWTYGEIVSSNTDETDEYVIINLYVKGTEESLDKYLADLKADGFTGDCQIQRKTIGGTEHIVDFTFFMESDDREINYLIAK